MSHGRIFLLDCDLRNHWYPKSGMSMGLSASLYWQVV